MIIWDPCSKTCGGSGVQKCMRVCVGQLSMNSITCDSVCPGSKFEKRACIIRDCSDLLIEDLSVGSHKWITYQQFFQFGTIFFSVEYNSLGCFKDSTPRALPLLLKSFRGNIDWTDMTKIVRACADLAKERGLPVFGIQYYRECWSGPDAENTYNKYGPSRNCQNGVGEDGTYYVYKIWVKVPVFFEFEGLYVWHNNP